MQEIWKDIYYKDVITGEEVDYRGMYQVSNLGRVKSLDRVVDKEQNGKTFKLTIRGRIMQWKYNQHYWMIGLGKNSKSKFFLVHRLVAYMFVPNPEGFSEVNHIDGNSWNPVSTNLEWTDHRQNLIYGIRMARWRKTVSKPVLQYSLNGDFIREWSSYKDAALAYGLNRGNISNCVLGRAKCYGGYMWKPMTNPIRKQIEPYVNGRRLPRKRAA